MGKLWENYLNGERIKKLHYQETHKLEYFWRTHTKQEIDRLEEKDNHLAAYEYKWGKAISKIPPEFKKSYPEASFEIINQENYLDFIS
jgi:hypothetical protein